MGTDDKQRQFDRIVEGLTADYPSLARGRRWSRGVITVLAIVGGLLWGMLSVAMVAWGAAGVVLTCSLVVLAGAALALDEYRCRRR